MKSPLTIGFVFCFLINVAVLLLHSKAFDEDTKVERPPDWPHALIPSFKDPRSRQTLTINEQTIVRIMKTWKLGWSKFSDGSPSTSRKIASTPLIPDVKKMTLQMQTMK